MVSNSSPLYTPLSLLFLLITFCLFNDAITSSISNTTSISLGLNTTIIGHYYTPDPVIITVAANQTEVYSWYPGGSATGATTFTLTGPTTFTTAYIDGIGVYYTCSNTLFTYSVPSEMMSTETLLAGVNTNNLEGYLTSGNYPWEVETTFVLNGPTVFVTQGVIVLEVEEASPPYELQSAPASNLDSPTTFSEPAAVSTASLKIFPTAFNPQTVSSLASSQPKLPVPVTEPSSSRTPVPSSTFSSSSVAASSYLFSTVPFSSVLNPSAVLVNSRTILLSSPATTSSSTPVSLASSGFLIASSQLLLPSQALTPLPSPLIVPGYTASELNPSAVVIGSQTAFIGGPAFIISSTAVSLASSGLIMGSSLLPLSSQAPVPLASLIAYGYTVSELNPSEVVIGSQTAVIGGPAITISGAPISLAKSGILVSSSFLPISLAVSGSNDMFTIGSQALTLLPSAVAFASTTLTAGAPGVTINGTPVSVGPGDLIIGTKTETLPSTTVATLVIHTGGAEGQGRTWPGAFRWWIVGFAGWGLWLI